MTTKMSAHNVNVFYGAKQAINDVSIDVDRSGRVGAADPAATVVVDELVGVGEGRVLYEKLTRVCEKFLADVSLNYLGCVPQDDWLRLSVQRQQPVVKAYPSSPSELAITEIARRTARWQAPTEPRGGVEFFLERILKQRGVAA